MAYVRALFVSLNESYPELSTRTFGSEALKNCTSGWWFIDVNKAKDIRYVFGVVNGDVVSVYRIRDDEYANPWPNLTFSPEETAPRRYIPTERVTIPEWQDATQWVDIDMSGGPIHYGTVVEEKGTLAPNPPVIDKSGASL